MELLVHFLIIFFIPIFFIQTLLRMCIMLFICYGQSLIHLFFTLSIFLDILIEDLCFLVMDIIIEALVLSIEQSFDQLEMWRKRCNGSIVREKFEELFMRWNTNVTCEIFLEVPSFSLHLLCLTKNGQAQGCCYSLK